ncbi:MFS general substrate transporter [Pholiota conissans]|uniref:MFS general substrate transporter n=1 Tax=Pholiota conissans TaxID=109636 RepID=A0A9P5YP04_9AGAR|nr:MFS general substrate transporter [Pholiota conissans]
MVDSDDSPSLTVQGSSSPSFEKEPLPPSALPSTEIRYCPQERNFLGPCEDAYDCGRGAWMTVASAWLVQFCTYGYISAFGVYQDYYTRVFLTHTTPSNISWIGSFQLFMQYAPGILVGRAFDAGYFHTMMAVGSGLQIMAMFMLSLVQMQSYYQIFLTQAVGMGLAQSLLFLPSLAVVGHHFKERRALATGIAFSGASVGGVLWPIFLNQLNKRISFANSIRATASLAAVMLILANVLAKTRPLKSVVVEKPNFKIILCDYAYLVSIASAFFINLGLFFPYFYLQLYAIDIGANKSLAFYSVTILNAGSFLGRLFPNFFADKLGPYNMLIPCVSVSSGLLFAMLGISNFNGVVVFGFLYGFSSGAYVALIPSLLARFSSHPGEHGTRIGIAFSIVGISLLIGTPIEGALLHGEHGLYVWYRPIVFCGVMAMSGAIGMTISRLIFVSQGRSSGGWRV